MMKWSFCLVLCASLLTINTIYLTSQQISTLNIIQKNVVDISRNSYYVGCMESKGIDCKNKAINYNNPIKDLFSKGK